MDQLTDVCVSLSGIEIRRPRRDCLLDRMLHRCKAAALRETVAGAKKPGQTTDSQYVCLLTKAAAQDFVVLRLNIVSPDAVTEHGFLLGAAACAAPSEEGATNFDP